MNRTGRLQRRQEKILDEYIAKQRGEVPLVYDDLPAAIISKLERVKDTETLWSDVERYLGDNTENPHTRGGLFGSDRTKLAAELVNIANSLVAKTGKYPELDDVAEQMANNFLKDINKVVRRIDSEMPYKAQYVLEEAISILEKSV